MGGRPTYELTDDQLAAFQAAVREAMATSRYVPGKLHGVAVRQVVQQPFVFHLAEK